MWHEIYTFSYIFFKTNNLICYISRLKEDEGNAFNSKSSNIIKLNNRTVLYLREVNRFLALVCILREDNFNRQGKNFSF